MLYGGELDLGFVFHGLVFGLEFGFGELVRLGIFQHGIRAGLAAVVDAGPEEEAADVGILVLLFELIIDDAAPGSPLVGIGGYLPVSWDDVLGSNEWNGGMLLVEFCVEIWFVVESH